MKIPGYSRRRRACCRSCDSETGIDGRWRCHQYCQQDHVDDADWHDCDGDSPAAGLIITNWDVVGPYFKKLWETIGPYFEAGWELLKKVLHGRRWGW